MTMADNADLKKDESKPMSREWNWHPELPVGMGVWFNWPLKPIKTLKWIVENYLRASDRSLIILYSLAIAFWLQPLVFEQATLEVDWVISLVMRNFAAFLLVTVTLHHWFYGIDGQGEMMRYERRPFGGKKNALFKFNYQIWDNVYYSLIYGVPIVCAYEIVFRLLYANDILWTISFDSNSIWYVLLFPLLAMWQSFHFYFIHRLLHWPPLYKYVHSIHHRNIVTGPWSGLSMHPVEHISYFSTLLIFFVIPSDPIHMIFLINWQLLGVVTSHSGFETIWVKDKSRLVIGSFFHQLHHRYYKCNYGSGEVPLDKWFSTFHDGSKEGTIAARERTRAGKL